MGVFVRLPGQQPLPGAGVDGFADQALFEGAVAEAFLEAVRGEAELAEQVVGVEEVFELGVKRVGFDQVGVIGGGEVEQGAGGKPPRVKGSMSRWAVSAAAWAAISSVLWVRPVRVSPVPV